MPQIFETVPNVSGAKSFDAYPEFNSLKPLSIQPQFTDQPDFDNLASITFVGTGTRLKAGDCLLLIKVHSDGSPPTPIAFKTIAVDPIVDGSKAANDGQSSYRSRPS